MENESKCLEDARLFSRFGFTVTRLSRVLTFGVLGFSWIRPLNVTQVTVGHLIIARATSTEDPLRWKFLTNTTKLMRKCPQVTAIYGTKHATLSSEIVLN